LTSIGKISKLAGSAYLIIFISGIFANFLVIENMVVPGDASATLLNITSNDSLFRLGIISFIIMVLADLFVTWALYILFKTQDENTSLLAAWFRLVNVTIFAIALFHLFTVLQLANESDSLLAFTSSQLQSQIMLSISAFNNTWLLGLIFFGIHLFILGYLIIKSPYVSNIIGYLLILAAFGYLTDSFAHLLLPSYDNYKDIFMLIVVIPGVIGELSLALWLLFKGMNKTSAS